jgi:putative transposase
VVFFAQYRKKAIFRQIHRELGAVFRALTEQHESTIQEGHVMSGNVHMMTLIPPRYAVSQVNGFIKEKSAIHIARRPYSAKVCGAKEEFRGPEFLRQRVFRINGG